MQHIHNELRMDISLCTCNVRRYVTIISNIPHFSKDEKLHIFVYIAFTTRCNSILISFSSIFCWLDMNARLFCWVAFVFIQLHSWFCLIFIIADACTHITGRSLSRVPWFPLIFTAFGTCIFVAFQPRGQRCIKCFLFCASSLKLKASWSPWFRHLLEIVLRYFILYAHFMKFAFSIFTLLCSVYCFPWDTIHFMQSVHLSMQFKYILARNRCILAIVQYKYRAHWWNIYHSTRSSFICTLMIMRTHISNQYWADIAEYSMISRWIACKAIPQPG